MFLSFQLVDFFLTFCKLYYFFFDFNPINFDDSLVDCSRDV